MSRKRKTYSLEFKQEAVKLVTEKGMSLNGASQSVGVCKSVLRFWVKKAEAGELGQPPKAKSQSELEAEIRQLKRQVSRLEEEKEILKKAAVFFAKDSQ